MRALVPAHEPQATVTGPPLSPGTFLSGTINRITANLHPVLPGEPAPSEAHACLAAITTYVISLNHHGPPGSSRPTANSIRLCVTFQASSHKNAGLPASRALSSPRKLG